MTKYLLISIKFIRVFLNNFFSMIFCNFPLQIYNIAAMNRLSGFLWVLYYGWPWFWRDGSSGNSKMHQIKTHHIFGLSVRQPMQWYRLHAFEGNFHIWSESSPPLITTLIIFGKVIFWNQKMIILLKNSTISYFWKYSILYNKNVQTLRRIEVWDSFIFISSKYLRSKWKLWK
jgi:hypothetical protein